MFFLSVGHFYSRGLSINDDISNLSVWVLNLSFGAIALGVMTPLYHWFFYQRIWPGLEDTAYNYLLAIVCYDFLYYWFHRASHRWRILWNIHSVHHQARRLTPTLGVRSSVFDFAAIWLILGFMYWLGFSSEMIITTLAFHGMYQIFLHNDWRINLGPLESLLNTPAHHRLHHAVNPEYLDKNFGSVFIVWDRIFGTFVRKSSPEKIGVLGLNAWHSPIKSNLLPWVEFLLNRQPEEIPGKIRIIFQVMAATLALASVLYFNWSPEFVAGGVLLLLILAELPSLKIKKPR